MNNKSDNGIPNLEIDVRKTFDIDVDMKVMGFKEPNEYVPTLDESYKFDKNTTLAILAGFSHNRRVMIQGYHGSGKSTHIEQVAARLNWPCIRINLDSHISRIDLLGKDAISLKDGKQITEFKEGILPWALQTPTALVFDEYDAGRPDVMFVIQRVLEVEGKLTLLDQNKVISPHAGFRLFATANTVGLGDTSGLYHGTQQINQGQMDRWHIVSTLNYLDPELELKVIISKVPSLDNDEGLEIAKNMISVANLSRQGFANGDISTLMSPRTVISWAENYQIFNDLNKSFEITFLNKCDETERVIIAEYYQRCFDSESVDSIADDIKEAWLKLSAKNSLSESIKEAVTATSRAISGNPEIEISFGGMGSSLPNPPKSLEEPEEQVKQGASLIININASPYDIQKNETRKEIVMKKALKLNVPIIYLNMVGGQDELVFDGGSFVVDDLGEIIYQASSFKEEVFHLDIDLKIKKQNDKSSLLIRPKTTKLKDIKSKPSMSENESIYSALKLGLLDYVSKNKFTKVLIGISGGIDSALTAAICVDALGAQNVMGVAMPSKYNSKDSLDDAIKLSTNLGIKLKTIEIEKIVDSFRETLKNSLNEELGQITDENIQSRVRGNILMGLSNQTGAMVVSTGNKSEMAVGYSTLYGDLAGGFALIKDLYKSKVYELSNYRNSISEVIPKDIITKEPSAELRPNQLDSDSLPDYEVLDKILNLYIEQDSSSEKIIATGIQPDLVYDVLKKVDRNEYKRKQVAPGVKLTQKAFGKDRRMPITNTYIRQKE